MTKQLPSYIRETNYKMMHNIVLTNTVMKDKFGAKMSKRELTCRLCHEHPETLDHLLLHCRTTENFRHYCISLMRHPDRPEDKIRGLYPVDDLYDNVTLSYYRHTLLQGWNADNTWEEWKYVFTYNHEINKLINHLELNVSVESDDSTE